AMTLVKQNYLSVRQRRVGIAVTGILLVLTGVWIYFDRDKCPTYPPVPAEYMPLLAEHVRVESALPLKPAEDSCGYSVSILGEGFVDGRRAQVVIVRSGSKDRPWRQFWIDPLTNQVMAVRNWNSANRPRLSAHDFGKALRRTVWGADIQRRFVSENLANNRLDETPKQRLPSYLPDGFELVGLRRCPDGWLQMIFSDGLYAMSLFERFLVGTSREHNREIVVYCWEGGLLARELRSGKELVIVADLPREELEKVVQSF
ncbi:MAG: hypothetical protein N3B12_07865, partial [Armatimonadetes bacterium]|nr:hypothetical protein [Armatimonadota bacterium]